MDSLTHVVLGATLGEILAGKKIGRKALLIGAVANSLPDIDFVTGLWMTPSQYFLAHRGFSHSFLFIAIVALLLSLAAQKINSFKISFRFWSIFFFIQLLSHVILDALNAYGVGWLEPFSHIRISYDILFVVDPLFTIWLLIACVVLFIIKTGSPGRMKIAAAGLAASMLYTSYAATNKAIIHNELEKSFAHENISTTKLLITPTPLNCWLWYVVADVGDGYLIEYRSVFDHTTTSPHQLFLKNDLLLDPIHHNEETMRLIYFSRDFFTVEKHGDTLVFNNLRFGQINGWENPQAAFIFKYNLEKPNSLFTIQQGRFAGWSKKTTNAFIKRIRGN